MKLRNRKLYKVQVNKTLEVDLYTTFVNAGFPSPAEDHMDVGLDLNDYLLKHPSSTFYIYAKGSSMVNAGIYDGDLMIVDRSLNPSSNNIVIDMTLTNPNCPVAGTMPESIGLALEKIKNILSIKVNLVWYPKWDKTMMSEDAKLALDIF